MKGIRFAGKMLVIGSIFSVPIALLVVVLFLQIKGDLDFAARERLGTAYAGAVRPLFSDLERYQIADGHVESHAIAQRIDRDFRAAFAFDAGEGAPLGVSAALKGLEQRWLARAPIDRVTGDALGLLVAISDNSLITLDPVLDGYYVGDTMVNKVPRLINRMAQADVVGTRILGARSVSMDQRIAITIASGQISSLIRDIARNVPIAVRAAPYLQPPLRDLSDQQHATSSAFLAAIEALMLPSMRAQSGRAEFPRLSGSALRCAFALYGATISAMDDVLRERIRALVYRECIIFSIVLATILGAAIVMVITTRSIAQRLDAVTSAIRTIVSEDMSQLVEIANAIARGEEPSETLVQRPVLAANGRDEAAVLASSYNSLVQRLADVNADFVTMTTSLSTRAFYDALTGLANRALFMERINQMMKRNRRKHDHLAAVLFLDLDRFKLVNDSLGHIAGDLLLIAVSRRLERSLRPGDTLARLGGDEFTILLEDISCERDATAFAERILTELAQPFLIAERETFASASIGISISRAGFSAPGDLLRDADIAMYRAKQLGKNRCELFAPEFLEHANRQLQLETDLAAAIERHEFILHYQPIVSLQTNELRGFEALVRWQHPQRGLLAPDEFIPTAEDNGAILAIGSQVIEEASRQARLWRDRFDLQRSLGISVNVSARQFSNPRLIDEIKSALARYDLGPNDLHIEITESAIMANPDSAAAVLEELQTIGLDVHLDDFGTGYSSLGYLHRFPVNTIKIDRSFISMAGAGVGNPQIVAAIASLARSLSMETTVEGIETAEQLAELRLLDCTNGQGYFLSRPVNAAAATELIANWQPTVLRKPLLR